MLLLRTIVLEHSGHDAPVNGALLCGFAVAKIASNFLAYSLDEEIEPGNSRVYIAILRKKSERYFLGAIESRENLQMAMAVFKQILTLAASSGTKAQGVGEPQIPYHFIDLRGCKLPPARPEDHHSLTIKKALVMKVISLGTSTPGLPAIESSELIVPSIRFSSRMVSPPRNSAPAEPQPQAPEPPSVPALPEPAPERPAPIPVEAAMQAAPDETPPPSRPPEADRQALLAAPAKQSPASLFEVDNTLTNLARVAHELTQQKLAVLEQQEAIGQLRSKLHQERTDFEQVNQRFVERSIEKEASLQLLAQSLAVREEQLTGTSLSQRAEQDRLDERAHAMERQEVQFHNREQGIRRKEEQLAAVLSQVSSLRYRLGEALHSLDATLIELTQGDPAPAASQLPGVNDLVQSPSG